MENLQALGIEICGNRTGSWQQSDYYDTDFLQKPDLELDLVLKSLRDNLNKLWDELCKEGLAKIDSYIPEWVRQIKLYNK